MTHQIFNILTILAAVGCIGINGDQLSAEEVVAAIGQAISPISKHQMQRDNCTGRVQMHLFAELTKIPLFLAETNSNLNVVVEQLQNAHNTYGQKMKLMLTSCARIAEGVDLFKSTCPSGSFYVEDFDSNIYHQEQRVDVSDIESSANEIPKQILEELPAGCDIIETDSSSLDQAKSQVLEIFGSNSVVSVGDLLLGLKSIVSDVSNRKKMAAAQTVKAFHDVIGFMPDSIQHGRGIKENVYKMGAMLSSFNVGKFGLCQMVNQGIKGLIGRTNCIA